MEDIFKEISAALKAMAKAKTTEDKLKYSEIVKNLCESLGVFLTAASDMLPFDMDYDEDSEPTPF